MNFVPLGNQQLLGPPPTLQTPSGVPAPGVLPSGVPPTLAQEYQQPQAKLTINERVAKAQAKLIENEYDIEAWNVLIKDTQVRHLKCLKLELIRF